MTRLNICLNCGVKFKSKKRDPNRFFKYCSPRCSNLARWKDRKYRQRMSEIHKGKPNSNKGKSIQFNTGRTHFKKGHIPWIKGKHHKKESNKKNRQAHLGKIEGQKHWNWKGGIASELNKIRNMFYYKEWRKKVFRKDYWTCQICGTKGKKIWADHIKPFSLIIKENKIKTIINAKNCEELWNINNGRTVCQNCALKLPTHGNRVYQFIYKEVNNV